MEKHALLNIHFPDGTVLQLHTFADPLIDGALDAFLDLKTRDDPLIQASARHTHAYLSEGRHGLKALHGMPPRGNKRILSACSIVAVALARPLASVAAAQSMEDRARAAANASRAKTSDSDALQQNYVTPALAGQSISTVDNSRTFAPNIACQKTATMLEVLVQPSGTGDLGTVTIARDTDLDGTVDSTSKLPVPVSGTLRGSTASSRHSAERPETRSIWRKAAQQVSLIARATSV